MPLYMDVHREMQGTTPTEVAEAHQKDVEVQDKYGVKYHEYWFNDAVGAVYCLVEAPSTNAAIAVHREAHGLLPDEIIEVERGFAEGFFGASMLRDDPADTALRTILFTDMYRSTAHAQRMGDARHMELLRLHDRIIREALEEHWGREVKHTGDGIMASFTSASRAMECAIAMQRSFAAHNKGNPKAPIRIRIGASAGEPVAQNKDLFGATVQLASRLCSRAKPEQILVACVIRDLCLGKDFAFADLGDVKLKGFRGPVRVCEVRWQVAEHDG
jgi:class 3 adenylate cyclase